MRCVGSLKKAARVFIDCRMPDFCFAPKSIEIWQRCTTKRTNDSDWWMLSWSVMKIHACSGSVSIVWLICLAKSTGRASGSERRHNYLTRCHLQVRNQAMTRAVTDVLELLQLGEPRSHWQSGMCTDLVPESPSFHRN